MQATEPPKFPAGEYVAPLDYDRKTMIEQLESVPARVRASVDGLSETDLDTKYRNWTVRQIVHHLADSHINCYVRFKWALTESNPQIKAYDETLWSELPDAVSIPLESSFRILEGVHTRWAQLVKGLSDQQMQSCFFHPEMKRDISLTEALPSYVWHADHHLAQIAWVGDRINAT